MTDFMNLICICLKGEIHCYAGKSSIFNFMDSRSAGMLNDRSYAGAMIAPPPSERIESAENGTESGVAE